LPPEIKNALIDALRQVQEYKEKLEAALEDNHRLLVEKTDLLSSIAAEKAIFAKELISAKIEETKKAAEEHAARLRAEIERQKEEIMAKVKRRLEEELDKALKKSRK